MSNYFKGSLEFLGIFLALVISYYELKEAIPNDPIIILEVEKLKTPRDTSSVRMVGHGGHDTCVNKSILLPVMILDFDMGLKITFFCLLCSKLTILYKPARVILCQK